MSSDSTKLNISSQREKVFGKQPELKLFAPCRASDGILKLSVQEKEYFSQVFSANKINFSFFIPASGSGSRMFEFLYEFINAPNEENRSLIERFLNHLQDFAFFNELPEDVQDQIRSSQIDLIEFIKFILEDPLMAYAKIPKAVIPFHKYGPFILNPVQEHILQGSKLCNNHPNFHFTIQQEYEDLIRRKVENMRGITGTKYQIAFSTQNADTNAVAFDTNGEPIIDEDGNVLTRPSGHGALLANLNEIDSELIFVRNIDNVQHFSKSDGINESWKILGGMLKQFYKELKNLNENPTMQGFLALNEAYHLFKSEDVQNLELREILSLLNRPSRVCGMVKNEGQSGGGPFWVEKEGIKTKQIVEKAQISNRSDQYKLMVQSTHFNPVLIALNVHDIHGNKFDLNDFIDESQYFVVNKKRMGQDIKFYEMPGLWNGSMAYWNTIFVELSNDHFSPVKTILDLLNEEHLDKD